MEGCATAKDPFDTSSQLNRMVRVGSRDGQRVAARVL